MAIATFAACGNPHASVGPTSEATHAGGAIPAGTTLTFVSGESDLPVAGARVLVGARLYATDAAGQVRLDEEVPAPIPIEISSSEFVVRQTDVRGGSQTKFTLWPRQSPTGLNEDWIRWVLYTPASGGATGGTPLHRLTATRVSVVPSADLLKDPAAMEAHEWAALQLSDATGGAVVFEVEREPTSPTVFRTVVDAKDPAMKNYAALAYRDIQGYAISGGRIVFASMSSARLHAVVAHELGHAFGLEHSPDSADLMFAIVPPQKRLSPRERLTMHLILGRRGGNRFPDDDRGVAMSAGGRRTILTPCGSRTE